MKVCDILEMALSPEMEEQKLKDQAKIKARRQAEKDWGPNKRRGSRLTGRGRGTGSPSGVSVAGVRS